LEILISFSGNIKDYSLNVFGLRLTDPPPFNAVILID